jgi:hypothetical protein
MIAVPRTAEPREYRRLEQALIVKEAVRKLACTAWLTSCAGLQARLLLEPLSTIGARLLLTEGK